MKCSRAWDAPDGFLAIEHDGDVDPDIVILSKALSGGYVPVGAVLCKKWIHERKFFPACNGRWCIPERSGQGSLAMAAGCMRRWT